VTDVRTSPDLRHAKVYVSVLGSGEERAATMDGLASAHGVLQTVVNRELRMKRTPTLEFLYDDTAERADRLERMLADAKRDPS
jgi:ribosome-binding factor A